MLHYFLKAINRLTDSLLQMSAMIIVFSSILVFCLHNGRELNCSGEILGWPPMKVRKKTLALKLFVLLPTDRKNISNSGIQTTNGNW